MDANPADGGVLAEYELFATQDVDEARQRIAAQFCDHRLELTSRTGALDVSYRTAAVGDAMSLNYLRYGDQVRITPGRFQEFFLVQIPLAGSARVAVGDLEVFSDQRAASIGSPTEPVDMVWSDGCEQVLIYIRRNLVEDLAASSPGERQPIVFRPRLELVTAAGSAWLNLVQWALADMNGGAQMLASPLVSHHFEHTLVSALLATQPHRIRAGSGPPSAPRTVGARAVRQVVELMEARPETPWRLAELAAHAGVSARALQEGFRSELGVTPMAQLRRIRLRRAHRDLRRLESSATSVSDVAARWGFGHLGRFAAAYRREYDELPSQTLAR